MPGTSSSSDNRREWYALIGLAVASFAVLESHGVRKRNNRVTLSHILKGHVQLNHARKGAFVMVTTGFAAWFTYHIAYEAMDVITHTEG